MDRKSLIRKGVYCIGSNLIPLSVSTIMVLLVPKYLSLLEYGYWQLFLFYFSYLGFFHFGWTDGVYLRYVGKTYYSLKKEVFKSQLFLLVGLELIISVVIFCTGIILNIDIFILFLFSTILLLLHFNAFCSFTLQLSSRFKEYSILTALEPALFAGSVLVALFYKEGRYTDLIICKLMSMLVICFISSYYIHDILLSKILPLRENLDEAKKNIVVGIKLMMANIAGMLVIGIIRFGISQGWDVETFGKISLTLGISNFLLVFMNSLGIVFTPIIKNSKADKAEVYMQGRLLLNIIIIAFLLLYYPLNSFLTLWLPKYVDSFKYMAVLFPICFFESRMALLLTSYMKAFREEKALLNINVLTVLLSSVLTLISCYIHDIDFMVYSMLVVFAFRCLCAERYMQVKMKMGEQYKNVITDFYVVILFCCSAKIDRLDVYILSMIVYFLIWRKECTKIFKWLFI